MCEWYTLPICLPLCDHRSYTHTHTHTSFFSTVHFTLATVGSYRDH